MLECGLIKRTRARIVHYAVKWLLWGEYRNEVMSALLYATLNEIDREARETN